MIISQSICKVNKLSDMPTDLFLIGKKGFAVLIIIS